MSFDRIAPFYRCLETIAFGNALQRARVCWVDNLSRPRRTLIIGEGNGRFLCELLRVYPDIEIDCVDASERMLELARSRLRRQQPESLAHVCFLHRDIRNWSPQCFYDLIVTHFFLDCFPRNELNLIVQKLAHAASPDAAWLIADFTIPQERFARAHAQLLLSLMYTFFRAAAGINARELVDATPYLNKNGFSRVSGKLSRGSVVRSDLFRLG